MPSSPLELPFQMGQVLLENGAEISRVQETMERVARAYDIEGFDVYVLTNSIFATATEDAVKGDSRGPAHARGGHEAAL